MKLPVLYSSYVDDLMNHVTGHSALLAKIVRIFVLLVRIFDNDLIVIECLYILTLLVTFMCERNISLGNDLMNQC